MKLRLLSDLHLEGGLHKELYDSKDADVLVIAGDLHCGPDACWDQLKQFAENVENVVYVPGNHEYYRYHIEDFDEKIRDWSKYTNIHFLNPGDVTVKGVHFIGAALWTNFAEDHISKITVPRMINDFKLISHGYLSDRFTADKCCELYDKHIKYIKQAYDVYKGTKVIVTHFLPDRACISPQFRGENLINNYFANNLGEWISDLKDVPYWLFGHTHDNVDLMIGDTRVIANPYGYGTNHRYTERFIEV